MPVQSLYELEALEPLSLITEKYGVEFTLFGSVASRIVLNDLFGRDSYQDLFSLCEHLSDINLAHSGPVELTSNIRAGIERAIPLAPWFHWSIIAQSEFTAMDRWFDISRGVPLRAIRLGRKLTVPDHVLEDSLAGVVRFRGSLSPGRRLSTLAEFEAETGAIFIYINAALDLWVARGTDNVRSIKTDEQNVLEAASASADRLWGLKNGQRARALQSLWRRTAGLAARMTPDWWQSTVDYFGLGPLLAAFRGSPYDAALQRLGDERERPVAVSSRVGTGLRVDPAPDADVDESRQASELLHAKFRDIAGSEPPRDGEGEQPPYRLEKGNYVLASIRDLTVHRGRKPDERENDQLPQDFVYLSFPCQDPLLDLQSGTDLAVLAIGRRPGEIDFLPVHCSVSRSERYSEASPCRFTIRVNLGALGDGVIEKMDLFVLFDELRHG